MKRLTEVHPDASRRALPYGLHTIEDDDIAAVAAAVGAPLLASGPRVKDFESQFSTTVGAAQSIACSSGTAALQLITMALDLKPGEVCVVPPISFLSTATAALLSGGEVKFCDVDPNTGLMDMEALESLLARTRQVRAVIPVHLGGRRCDVSQIQALANRYGADVIEDACHALGGKDFAGQPIGASRHSIASTFSFHPVKTITTGEGGMATTSDHAFGEKLRAARSHCVTRDPDLMTEDHAFDPLGQANPWAYEQQSLSGNFRMSEMQAALGISQLRKLHRFVSLRRSLADAYIQLLKPFGAAIRIAPQTESPDAALHLFSVNIDFDGLGRNKATVVRQLLADGVGTQVHYIPIYRQPYFKRRYGEMRLEGAETYYRDTLTLPLFPTMTFMDVDHVVDSLASALGLG